MKSRKIAIIGAGYTGLVAAYRLAQKGHSVTILEKGESLGGLASDFKIEGTSLERAYHHIFKTDRDIIALAEELGVRDKLKWHDSSIAIYYGGQVYPFKGALDLLRFSPLSFINRIRAGITVLYLQQTGKWQKFGKVSALDWMYRYAGKQVTEVIWEPLLRGKFADKYDTVSMAWLWARVHTRAGSREIGGEKLGYFDGGFQVFTDALVARLRSLGVNIETGVDISSLTSLSSGRVKITFGDGKSKTFDSVISTTPSYVFARLIAGNKSVKQSYLDKLGSIGYLGARLMIFSSSQDISPYYWHNINDVDLPFLVFINQTKLVDPSHYGGKYVYYIAAYLDRDDELFKKEDKKLEKLWLDSLSKVFPDFDRSQIREKHFFSFGNAQHIVDADYASKIPSMKTPLKNVYLSNFSMIYPEDRGVNFAVRDGERVAKLASGSKR